MRMSAAALLFASAVFLHVVRDRVFAAQPATDEQLLYVRSAEAMDRLVLGFDAIAADVYWIRAIQHYGGNLLRAHQEKPSYELLYPLLDMTTTLDPYFYTAYRFGAIFLSERYPDGPGRPDLAIALLRKGIAAQPTRWHYYHDIAFVHYWSLDDPHGAAVWFRRAASLPDAPNWLLPIAAAILTEADDTQAARQLWQQILQADEEWLRRRAARGLQQVDALEQIDALTKIVSASPRRDAEPYSWSSLIGSGALRGIPVDPAGTPYELDPETGRVSVAEHSPLFPMRARRGHGR